MQPMLGTTAIDRFMRYVDIIPRGCWEWRASKGRDGYGNFSVKTDPRYRGTIPAHRFAYEFNVGLIPEGQSIDHLCGNTGCVNWRHLKVSTQRENVLRSDIALAAINARKTHCHRGHLFDEANTYEPAKRPGRRYCKACARERESARLLGG